MQIEVMYSRLLNISIDYDKTFFLFEPRGTGKTTWIKNSFLEAQLRMDIIVLIDF